MSTTDAFDLARFAAAQEGVFERACAELEAGSKQSHWMWFVFPQMKGLGFSQAAQFYGIGSLEEARAYLAHPLLGPRLEQATRSVLMHAGRPLREIFGTPDDLKFRSSMTLFAAAAGPQSIYEDAIRRMCSGARDARTLALIADVRRS